MTEIVHIKTYVSDMIAAEREVVAHVEKQLGFEEVKNTPEVKDVLVKLQDVLYDHILVLEHHLRALGGHPSVSLKSAVADVYGAAAAALQSMLKTRVSKVLRDDHTALSLVCVEYEMLYLCARVTGSDATAQIAIKHLRDLTPYPMDLGELIPGTVVRELLDLDPTLDASVLDDARGNISSAWRTAAEARQKMPQAESQTTS